MSIIINQQMAVCQWDGAAYRRVRSCALEQSERTRNDRKEIHGGLAFGKTVSVKERDIDRYGRIVGEVVLPSGPGMVVPAVCPERRELKGAVSQEVLQTGNGTGHRLSQLSGQFVTRPSVRGSDR
jgi:hypothetical protein